MRTSETKNNGIPDLSGSLAGHLGIRILTLEKGFVRATMPVDERTSRPCLPVDILNGGASLALAETVAGYGSSLLCKEDETPCGIQVSANHVHMAQTGQSVEATARLIHHGRTSHVWNVDITGLEGKLISTARIVNLIIKQRT